MSLQKIFSHFLNNRLVATDTRNIRQGAIFFALKGERFNGNQFAQQALDAGASLIVADEETGVVDDRIVRVQDSLATLQHLANRYRKTFSIPILAITGSNGKTTTKELIRDILKSKYRVHATGGNFNNHIGVPLTLLSMPAETEIAVIEMGANHLGEIKSLCEITEPGFGMITNIGKAHLEGFGGIEGVKKGKFELYEYVHANGGKIFVNTGLPMLNEISNNMDRIDYALKCNQFELDIVSETPALEFAWGNNLIDKIQIKTHLAGAYNLYNIASAIAVGKHFGVNEKEMAFAIESYTPDNSRSQLLRTKKNLLIMDAYNANPTSMLHAMENLAKQPGKKFFILGDMLELGNEGPLEHKHILAQATRLGLDGIAVGEIFSSFKTNFPYRTFLNNDEAKKYLQNLTLHDAVVLIKGSRGLRLEELLDAL